MHAYVSRQTFDLLSEFQKCRNVFLITLAFNQQRLGLFGENRVGISFFWVIRRRSQRGPLAWCKGDELSDAIDKVVWHIEHASTVTHGRLCRHRSERCDLAHTFGAIFFAHVIDDTISAVLTEVDIEVGHRYAFRV